jgi:hypothetical protein
MLVATNHSKILHRHQAVRMLVLVVCNCSIAEQRKARLSHSSQQANETAVAVFAPENLNATRKLGIQPNLSSFHT